MRHESYLTTQWYINMASQLDEAVGKLHVPDVLKGKSRPEPRKRLHEGPVRDGQPPSP
jgi:hypothetical protein